jgi:UPF0755 protein
MIEIIEPPKKKFLTRNETYIILAAFCVVLFILIMTFFSPNYYSKQEPIEVDIKYGYSFANIVDSLYVKGIIPSKTNMKIAAFIFGAEKKIKAGRYAIKNGLNYIKLVEVLSSGPTEEQILVTIPEGIWQNELAKILQKDINCNADKILALSKSKSFITSLGIDANSLEGYLLPDSYYFYPSSSEEEILRKLKNQMDKIFTPEAESRIAELHMTKHQILTLASIIDGESNYVPEFKTIAGVYYNRLKKGMPLQADPTIQYLIKEQHKNKVYYKDLQIDSKYNTYKYTGLPPAPINNPGKDAILAALYPEQNNYLYFVANGNGHHIFSRTIDEHEINVKNYRQWRRTQR